MIVDTPEYWIVKSVGEWVGSFLLRCVTHAFSDLRALQRARPVPNLVLRTIHTGIHSRILHKYKQSKCK